MKSIRWDRVHRSVFAGLLLATLPTLVFADDSDDVNAFVRSRTYIGILGTSAGFSGSGFGTTALVQSNPYEITIAPTFAQNFGWGVLLGRREGPYAAEVSYWQSVHQGSWTGSYPQGSGGSGSFGQTVQGSATFNSINLDFKRYFFTDIDIQPFLALGVNIPWIDVPGSSETAGSVVGNTTFEGIGFDLGAGVEYYLDTTFSLTGGVYQRWTGYGQYKGVNNVDEQVQNADGNPASFTASGLDFYIGASVGFI